MRKLKLTFAVVVWILGTAITMADEYQNLYISKPQPAGGIKSLEKNTVYPLFDRQNGNCAEVILNFHVDENGNVSNIEIVKSGGPSFDKSAIIAVKNTEWEPAMQNGIPVSLTYALPFEYRMK